MKIAVMGAGSLGTIIGAYISDAGYDTTLIDANQEHVLELNKSGAAVVGTTELIVPVKAITPDQMEGTYDLVLLLTKQLDNEMVLQGLLTRLHGKSIVCSLQNGIPEEEVISYAGGDKVIAGSVDFGATWIKPGVSELTTDFAQFKANAFKIGELDGTVTPRIKEVQAILGHVGNTVISENLIGVKWSKLMINVTMSGLSAALNCSYGDILNNDTAIAAAVHLGDETVRVGHALGVNFLRYGHKIDFNEMYLKDPDDLYELTLIFKKFFKSQVLLRASMLQDLEKQRKTEIDFINGVVLQKERSKT